MGFSKVYKSLQEIFPQIDARVLRAVAIEHNKDVDAAVEIVLAEIIPFFTEQSKPSTPPTESISIKESSKGDTEQSRPRTPPTESISIKESSKDAIATTQTADSTSVNATDSQNDNMMNAENQQSFHDANDGNSELAVPGNILGDSMEMKVDVYSPVDHEGEGNSVELTFSESVLENRMQMKIDVHSHGEAGQSINEDSVKAHQIVSGKSKTSETDLNDKYPESSIKNAEGIPSHSLISQDEDNGMVENSHLETEFGSSTDKEGDHGKSYEDSASLTNHEPATPTLKSNSQLEALQDKTGSGLEELDVSLTGSTASKMENASNIVGIEDESTLNASLSQSNQSNIIAVLEEVISEARNNKKTLFSSMQSVISLLREVELKEQAAEQAKGEAAMGGLDILVKSEELKEMVQKAEEANATYSGEVYGEKAILGTELRELQSRVLSLSDERDKSLAVLNEMQQTLEVRLTEAQNEIKSAEQEKMEKEKVAMKALAEQELVMEKVVQESKLLNQQAEDNAKLREFLVDRGRVVDMLQGEIGVICHDVKLLKENFDERVPFSKSLSSSQTSCILASSTSSSKTLIPDQADSFETQKERSAGSSTHNLSEEEDTTACDVDRKQLLEDGWEVFDHQEIYS